MWLESPRPAALPTASVALPAPRSAMPETSTSGMSGSSPRPRAAVAAER